MRTEKFLNYEVIARDEAEEDSVRTEQETHKIWVKNRRLFQGTQTKS